MSLKGDRYEAMTDISFFMNEVQTRGGVASILTAGSGSSLDQSVSAVTYAANSSGQRPVGVLMGDVVNYDLTRQHINFQRDEVQLGGKVRLLRKGFCVTNVIVGTPAKGDSAYLTGSGNFIPFNTVLAGSPNFVASPNPLIYPYCGYFMSTKDEDGYAKVSVDL